MKKISIEDLKKANTERLCALAGKAGIEVTPTTDRKIIIELLTEAYEIDDTTQTYQDGQDTGSTVSTGQFTSGASTSNSIPVSNTVQAESFVNRADPPARQVNTHIMLGQAQFDTGLRAFSGDDNHLVQLWLNQFEEYATLMQWTDMQKLVVAKKSLSGTALIVSQLKVYRNWNELKQTLIDEFDQVRTSKEIHTLLSMTRMRNDESLLAYSVRMQELAVQGGIEDSSLMQYIIDGINDTNTNKILLYGATTMQEFKRKLNVYRVFKTQAATTSSNTPAIRNQFPNSFPTATAHTHARPIGTQNASVQPNLPQQPNATVVVRCTFCNRRGHEESVCRLKRITCYICKELGHKVSACPNRSNTVQVCNKSDNTRAMQKMITLNGLKWNALIDTGSDVSIVKQNIFDQIQPKPTLRSVNIKLSGVGNGSFVTLGAADLSVIIDSALYKIEMFVVRKEDTQSDIIIGNNFLANHKVVIEKGVVSIYKPEQEMYNINIEDNTPVWPSEVQTLISNYKPSDTVVTEIQTEIILKDDSRVYHNPRRLAPSEKSIVDKQIDSWLQDGIISVSSSEYASPILLTRKKDGSMRLCVDYRKLNRIIIKERFPFPNMEEQLDKLQEGRYFSTLDLENGFFHVPVEKGSRKYTAFCCHKGIFEFNKTPFGLCNSPSSFQRFICDVFRELIYDNKIIIYVDDIIIQSETKEEGIERLKNVLDISARSGLKFKWKKCQFLTENVEYLGFIVQKGTIQPTEDKLKAVSKYPLPVNVKQIQSFLGLTGYFRKFIEGYASIAAPLSNLLQKDNIFYMGPREIRAFEELKLKLINPPLLHLFNPNLHTELHTDASKDGYGAILLQRCSESNELHPTYFYSKKTTTHERNYTSFEQEVLAIINSLKKLRVYVINRPFHIITDCKAFTQTMEKKDVSSRVARWAIELQEYEYTIEHRSGTKMRHVDALSRAPIQINTISALLQQAQEGSEQIQDLRKQIEENRAPEYCIANGLVYKIHQGRQLLVITENIAENIIQQCHEENGHFGFEKISRILKQQYHCNNFDSLIKKSINNCMICMISERKKGKKEGFLHPIHKEDQPLQTYHVDHLGPMTETDKQYRYIFGVTDAFSKFSWLYATKTVNSAEVIKCLEVQQNVFGSPRRIVSDHGSAFTSALFNDYCEENEIEHVKTTVGVPRGNGQIERLNTSIISVLTKLCVDSPHKWYKHLPTLQTALNGTYHRAIGQTPFEVLTGVKMRSKSNINVIELLNEEALLSFNADRDDIREKARHEIAKIQKENITQHNKNCKTPHLYKVGDLVFIKRTQFGSGLKIKPNFLGPYRVTHLNRNDRYRVEKVGSGEGPKQTSTSSDYMKLYSPIGTIDE